MGKKKESKESSDKSIAKGTSLSSLSKLRRQNIHTKTSNLNIEHQPLYVDDFPQVEGADANKFSSIDHIEYLDNDTNLKDIVTQKSNHHKEQREQNSINSLNTELNAEDYKADDFDITKELENFKPITDEDDSTKVEDSLDKLEVKDDFDEPEVKDDFDEPEVKDDFDEPEVKDDFDEPEVKDNFDEPEVKDNFDEPEVQDNFDGPEVQDNLDELEVQDNLDELEVQDNLDELEVQDNFDEPEVQDSFDEPELENTFDKAAAEIPLDNEERYESAETVDNLETIEEPEILDELEELEELDLLESADDDELNYLTENVDGDGVKGHIKVDLKELDPSLKNSTLDYTLSTTDDENEDELYGVKKTEVFYHIDKEIYSKRAKTPLDLSKVKNIKSGMTLPISVAVFLIMIIPIAYIASYFFFQKASTATLQDNVIKDNSIQGKLREKQQELYEAEKEKLERQLQENRAAMLRIESNIEEELKRRRAEIENEYKDKLARLNEQSYSQVERDRLIKQLQDEKDKALLKAENEKERRLREQNLLLEQEKNRLMVEKSQVQEKEKQLEELLKNREMQIAEQERMLSLEKEKASEESLERQRRLEELSERNRLIQEFNETVLNLITGGIEEFKKGNKELGVKKLLSVLEYYDAREEFVLSTEELLAKRQADTFFIETISDLVTESKNSPLYSQEFINTVDKFKAITLYYRDAELYYSQNQLVKAQAEYLKVLNEFDEINYSYQRLRLMEKQIQNSQASTLYAQAIEQMKLENYNQALTLLERIVTETPESDFSSQALANITQLAGMISREDDSEEEDQTNEREAKALFETARSQEDSENYESALTSYRNVIIKYPASSYTREALNRALKLKERDQKVITETETILTDDAAALTAKFRESYDKFLTAYQAGNLKEARGHYFNALSNAFNSYTDNSLSRFRSFEDEYFSALLTEKTRADSENYEKQLAESKASITEKYEKLLAEQKTDFDNRLESEKARLEDEKKALEERYSKLLTDETSEGITESIKEYEEQISKQKDEIARLTRLKEENEKELEQRGDLSAKEIATLKAEYDEQITNLNNQLGTLAREKSDLEKALSERGTLSDSQITSLKSNYESQINKLNNKIDELERIKTDYEEQLSDSDKSTDEKITDLKKSYDSRILSLNSEIAQLKSEQLAANTKYADYDERLATLQQNLSTKQGELEEEKQFTISLKQQLADLYKKYAELQETSDEPIDEDKTELANQIAELEKKYRNLEKLYERARFSEDEIREEIETELRKEYNRKVSLEVEKVKTDFADELNKIKNVELIEEEIASKKAEDESADESKEKVFQNKIIARISEIIDDSVAFQFLSTKLVTELDKGDTVQLIRYQSGKETVIGYMTITYTSSTSLFGRGRIKSLEPGQSARVNDIVKN